MDQSVATEELVAHENGNRDSRNHHRVPKGRRRRAAAENRRMEEEIMAQWLDEEAVAPVNLQAPKRSGRKRRDRRKRRELINSEFYQEAEEYDTEDLELALAVSLSLSEDHGRGHRPDLAAQNLQQIDMSYESLSLLENVKCVAPIAVLNSLPLLNYKAEMVDEQCAICVEGYKDGDEMLHLGCSHRFHSGCISEWLLNYSKLCPICKFDVVSDSP